MLFIKPYNYSTDKLNSYSTEVANKILSSTQKPYFTTVGIYSSQDYIVNGVTRSNLAGHIWYNLQFRPGRALFVEGHLLNEGGGVDLKGWKIKVQKLEKHKDTAPYR